MEAMNMAVQAAAEMQKTSGAGIPSRASLAAAGGDGFTQILLQLIDGLAEDGDVPDSAAIWMPEWEGEGKQKTGTSTPWEMLMAMLETTPWQMDFRQFTLDAPGSSITPTDIGAVREVGRFAVNGLDWQSAWANLKALQGTAAGYAGLEEAGKAALEVLAGATDNPAMQILLQGALNKPSGDGGLRYTYPAARDAMAAKGPAAPVEDGDAIPIQVLGYQGPEKDEADFGDALSGQEHFRQAVQEARSKLAGKGGKPETDQMDILLSARLIRTQPENLMKAAGPQEGPGIPEQILAGLSKNLQAGRGEFVLKLEPEGLGEITIKLLAKEGRTTLRIITASAETARLINNDFHTLQNALRPIQVEVHEAVPETEAGKDANRYFPGFDQFNQFNQFDQYRNQGEPNQSKGGGQNHKISGVQGDYFGDALTEPGSIPVPGAELDMYI